MKKKIVAVLFVVVVLLGLSFSGCKKGAESRVWEANVVYGYAQSGGAAVFSFDIRAKKVNTYDEYYTQYKTRKDVNKIFEKLKQREDFLCEQNGFLVFLCETNGVCGYVFVSHDGQKDGYELITLNAERGFIDGSAIPVPVQFLISYGDGTEINVQSLDLKGKTLKIGCDFEELKTFYGRIDGLVENVEENKINLNIDNKKIILTYDNSEISFM